MQHLLSTFLANDITVHSAHLLQRW